jgi:hypothetical protein
MALAETARLITELQLRDQMTPGLLKARGELGLLNTSAGGLQKGVAATEGRLGVLGKAATGLGGAFSTLRGRIGSVISGPLGFLGFAAAGVGVIGVLESSITFTRDFAKEVGLMAAATGLTTEKTSALAAVFTHFGVDVATALTLTTLGEKNLFKLGGTAEKAAKFQATYGLSLVDSAGQLKDFNTILLDSADFFTNKHIPAAQRDAAVAAIYGRGWKALIPVLSAGRDKIAEVEKTAADLGLTFTADNFKDLVKLRDATRDWTTALDGLKLQIGLKMVPALTGLANSATEFLRKGGTKQIVGFFQTLLDIGKRAAYVITHQVVPVFGAIYGAWMKVPSALRDLIITGLVANKTIKFLFGFSPLALAKGLAGSLFGQLFSRGSSPANALWVQSVGGIGSGGGPGGLLSKVPMLAGLGELTLAGMAGAAASLIALAAPLLSPYLFQGPPTRPGAINDPRTTEWDVPTAPGTKPTRFVVPSYTGAMLTGLIPGFPTGAARAGSQGVVPVKDLAVQADLRNNINILRAQQRDVQVDRAARARQAAAVQRAAELGRVTTKTGFQQGAGVTRQTAAQITAATQRVATRAQAIQSATTRLQGVTHTGFQSNYGQLAALNRKKTSVTVNNYVAIEATFSASAVATSIRRRITIAGTSRSGFLQSATI